MRMSLLRHRWNLQTTRTTVVRSYTTESPVIGLSSDDVVSIMATSLFVSRGNEAHDSGKRHGAAGCSLLALGHT